MTAYEPDAVTCHVMVSTIWGWVLQYEEVSPEKVTNWPPNQALP